MAQDPTRGRMAEVGAEHGDRPVEQLAVASRNGLRPVFGRMGSSNHRFECA